MTERAAVVLMVDDSEQDLALFTAGLRRACGALAPRVARSVDEARRYLEGKGRFADRVRHPLPRLVLLDIQMPAKDGFHLLTWLRRQKGDVKRLPVVMLTTSRDPREIRKAYELGADSFLVKPTGFRELCALLGDLCVYWLGRDRRGPAGEVL